MSESEDKKAGAVPEGFRGIVPERHSAVRHILADVHGVEGILYRPLKTYEEAKSVEDAYVVLEGDWGGQIYVVAPMRLVRCKEEDLRRLLQDLDEIGWPGQPDGQGLYYERYHAGQTVPGGMGGGAALDNVWTHEEFAQYGIEDKILKVLSAELPSMGLSAEELGRIREIDRARRDQRLKELATKERNKEQRGW